MKRILFILFITLANCLPAQNWQTLGSGLNYGVRSMFEDSIANLLYVGGDFTSAGGIYTRGIASWNGNSWDSLGRGLDNYPPMSSSSTFPNAICRFNNELYIGGNFTKVDTITSPYLARWDGTTWNTLPELPNQAVSCMMVYNNELYVGGWFDHIGSNPCQGFAKWNGTTWTCINMPTITFFTAVYTICEYQNEIYVGGNFSSAAFPNDSIENIIKYDGTNWTSVGGGIHGYADEVESMTVFNNELYLSGLFTSPDGNAGNYIQRWNGNIWRDVGGGTNLRIWQINKIHNSLYAVGAFTIAGGIPAPYIAKWDGANWCGFGDNLSNSIHNIELFHDTIHIGGGFGTINSIPVHNIAKWVGGNYTDSCTTTGISELGKADGIRIYPNPTNGVFTISAEGTKMKEVNVMDVVGKEIVGKKVNEGSTTIDISGMAKGMYFIRVMDEKGNGIVRRIVKE